MCKHEETRIYIIRSGHGLIRCGCCGYKIKEVGAINPLNIGKSMTRNIAKEISKGAKSMYYVGSLGLPLSLN
jgi:ribosomal protein L37AE/L43A